jgi:hypothetical protein
MRNPLIALDRAPKVVRFGAAGLIQIGLVALMVVDRVNILRTGTDVTLQTRPVDPRDLLRGDYVALGYDISNLAAGVVKDPAAACAGATVFVTLAPNPDGFYQAVFVHAAPVQVVAPEVVIRGRVTNGVRCGAERPASYGSLQVRYGLERSSRRVKDASSKPRATSASSRSSPPSRPAVAPRSSAC